MSQQNFAKKHLKTSFVLVALYSAMSIHSSHAQAADATVNLAGQVTANTCVSSRATLTFQFD